MGVDSITIDGTVPVPARTTPWTQSLKKRRQTGRMTPSRTVGHLVWAWRTLQIHGGCSSWLPLLSSDFGEEHETQVAFARTSPHRTDPARLLGLAGARPNARRSHRNGDGHVRRGHPG